MPKSTFIIAEQSYLIRKGLTSLIEKIPNTQIVQQYESSEELIAGNGQEVDFLIINANMVDEEFIKQAFKKSQVIVITHENIKLNPKTEWAEIIELNEHQDTILKKINSLIGNKETNKPKSYSPEEISEREADIVRNIALGHSNKEIADKLFISTHTVVTHRKNITRKLGIKTVPGLTIYAILNKLIDINEAE